MKMDYGYQQLYFNNADFPIILHKEIQERTGEIIPHWHESLEILYIISGTAIVKIGANEHFADVGDIVVVNSQEIHRITFKDDCTVYYCLTLKVEFCKQNGFPVENTPILSVVKDQKAREFFNNIISENEEQGKYFKTAIKNGAISLMLHLYRNFCNSKSETQNDTLNPSTEIAKKAMAYIRTNYKKPISTNIIGKEIGVSLFHLCRSFKGATGMTIIQYINFIRCSDAKAELLTNNFSVGEVAEMCGFSNLSYFSKTYTAFIGYSPSKTLKSAKKLI